MIKTLVKALRKPGVFFRAPESSEEDWSSWRQGDIIRVRDQRALRQHAFFSQWVHAAVISQTCDIVLPKRPTLSLAPVRILGEVEARAATLENPRYVQVLVDDKAMHVDLSYVSSFEKKKLNANVALHHVDNQVVARRFGNSVGRWFGRFAFPDEVVPWLRPLEQVVRSKYCKPESALGRVLQDVVEFRVEADWTKSKLDITVHLILKSGTLPLMGPESSSIDAGSGLAGARTEAVSTLAQAAENIERADFGARIEAWNRFADVISSICKPSKQEMLHPAIAGAVRQVSVQITQDDEFNLAQWRRSERLDLDYLSFPTPL